MRPNEVDEGWDTAFGGQKAMVQKQLFSIPPNAPDSERTKCLLTDTYTPSLQSAPMSGMTTWNSRPPFCRLSRRYRSGVSGFDDESIPD
jgi:hypothetical protein